MKIFRLALLASVSATPLLAQDTREMGAHVHGVSTLELAVEDGVLEMTLLSPGMDIVGFEYAASSVADKDAVEAAIRTLLVPENIVTLPDAAECRLTEARAQLHAGDHEEHAEGEVHDHDEHDDGASHGDGAQHSAFHASYTFACEHPEALTTIGFPFFERFGNAQVIEAQFVTDAGAGAADIRRDTAQLTLNRP